MFSGVGVTALVITVSYLYKSLKEKETKIDVFTIESPQAKSIISLYSLLPSFILKRLFPEVRVNSSIKIDIVPGAESIRLNLGELPSCQIWMQVTNHLPFDIIIENIKANLNYNGCVINVEATDHIDISKHCSIYSILLEGNLTGEQANHCSENKASYTSISFRSRIRTSFGIFKKQLSETRDMNVHIINKREKKPNK